MSQLPRRRKDTRPAELLDAALAVFAEKGFAAARMEDIAARAGAAKGTLYLYFPSKEAVFEALVRTLIVPNLDRAEAVAAAHAGPVAPLLRQAAAAPGRHHPRRPARRAAAPADRRAPQVSRARPLLQERPWPTVPWP